ncbi:DNA alkylation repair protein [Candidatus Falkowbacteria bacterium CG10_big_fil_rev_8_21_14_0_10_39_11]|uniref:DNA alkylation repair protein n=1 Tax=Candidatus Falkowbacteria bacterium CG10_big_fil_rev_8_21_14_0_10_39_11 TaxID=1974565 RepID=A0A2H0V5L6_9BACT|nr:MAG: DNA alkylation repair protein [Candidatus Falkowbacteria bacterium CG10_big_fil_rev_8_21_14_0_10_39_11]
MSVIKVKNELKALKNPEKIAVFDNFFKTGKGQYGEGDEFYGLTAQEIKDVAKKYQDIDLTEVLTLLKDKVHEVRMAALRILVHKYKKGDDKQKKQVFDIYLKNTKYINNWDLIDVTTPDIVGDYLLKRDRAVLYKLARSKSLWEKRISMLATYTFIRNKEFEDTLKIAEILLADDHDLIHKAVGWMLREVGNRDREVEELFLRKYYQKMPRTMLRYAIEKFPESLRQKYLKGEM